MLNAARNDKQVLIGHRFFIVDDKKRNQLDKKMICSTRDNHTLQRDAPYTFNT